MNALKTQPQSTADQSGSSEISGKLVIIAVMFVAISGAVFSWFYRYNATHRAAEFWGPQTASLIRDAPMVRLYYLNDKQSTVSLVRDISKARGLTHLRNALLEDRSFNWPAEHVGRPPRWRWALGFSESGQQEQFVLELTEDFEKLICMRDKDIVLNCEPISAGLRLMVDEFTAAQTSEPGPPTSR